MICSRQFLLPALLAPLLVSLAAQSLMAQEHGESWKAPARQARVVNPVADDDASIAAGKAIYERECLSCHGTSGRFDGRAAKALAVKSRILADPAVARQSDGELFWKTTVGNKPMPAFDPKLSETDRWNVVNFLRTFAPREHVPEFDAPGTYRAALSKTVDAYESLLGALANDDLAGAAPAAESVGKAAAELALLDGQDLPESQRPEWQATVQSVVSAAGALKPAQDLKAARTALSGASEALVASLQKFGHAESAPLRVVRCGMAFDGKGGRWIQRGNEIRNPYLGQAMASCGTIEVLLDAALGAGS